MSYVITITGPAGAGKSTTSKELAKKLDRCANIEVDHVKHFLECAFSVEYDKDGNEVWSYSEWELMGNILGTLAKKYTEHGYNVIINGYLKPSSYIQIQSIIDLTHKFLLLPDVDLAILRDSQRPKDTLLGEKGVRRHYSDFQHDFFNVFLKIDSSDQTVEETTNFLLQNIKQ